jgi:hypothetical protein
MSSDSPKITFINIQGPETKKNFANALKEEQETGFLPWGFKGGNNTDSADWLKKFKQESGDYVVFLEGIKWNDGRDVGKADDRGDATLDATRAHLVQVVDRVDRVEANPWPKWLDNCIHKFWATRWPPRQKPSDLDIRTWLQGWGIEVGNDEVWYGVSGSVRGGMVRNQGRWTGILSTPGKSYVIRSDAEPIAELLSEHKNVILEGPAGTGKTHTIDQLENAYGEGRIRTVVCHPSLGYEDLVIGLRPNADGGFDVKPGHLLEMVKQAVAKPAKNFLLVLDEINRCNTASVFGDVLMIMEDSRRIELSMESDSVEAFTKAAECAPAAAVLPFEFDLTDGDAPVKMSRVLLPSNLHVLGTMNTSDRSIAPLDLALRRRFLVHRQDPLPKVELESDSEVKNTTSLDCWEKLNAELRKLVSPDAVLGHAYFFKDVDLETLWRYQLLPQLAEILVNFNKLDVIGTLPLAENPSQWTLELVGDGIGRYPIVTEKKDSSDRTTNASGGSDGDESDESDEGDTPEPGPDADSEQDEANETVTASE